MRYQDNREHDRTEVTIPVNHTCRGNLDTSRARNLSYGGMQVELPDPSIGCGERLGLEFALPWTALRVLASAEVIYRTNGLAGVRFSYVPTPMRRHLDAFVSTRLVGAWFR